MCRYRENLGRRSVNMDNKDEVMRTIREVMKRRALEDEVLQQMMLEAEIAERRRQREDLMTLSSPLSVPGVCHREGFGIQERSRGIPDISSSLLNSNVFGVTEAMLHSRQTYSSPKATTKQAISLQKGEVSSSAVHANSNSSIAPRTENKPEIATYISNSAADVFGTVNKPLNVWTCHICKLNLTSQQVLDEHLEGRKHKAKEKALGNMSNPKPVELPQKLSELSSAGSSSNSKGIELELPQSGHSAKLYAQHLKILQDTPVTDEAGACVELPLKPANSDGSSSGKRKSETPPDSGAAEAESSKKPKTEWRCDLCQVCVTGEHSLIEHFAGKKHIKKSTLEGVSDSTTLLSQSAKSEELGTSPKEATDFGLLCSESARSQELDECRSVIGSPEMQTVDEKEIDTELPSSVDSRVIEDEQLLSGELGGDEVIAEFNYWCSTCKFGTDTEEVMTAHRAEEKHVAMFWKNRGGVIAIRTAPDHVDALPRADDGKEVETEEATRAAAVDDDCTHRM